jgi:hypothetical protein
MKNKLTALAALILTASLFTSCATSPSTTTTTTTEEKKVDRKQSSMYVR